MIGARLYVVVSIPRARSCLFIRLRPHSSSRTENVCVGKRKGAACKYSRGDADGDEELLFSMRFCQLMVVATSSLGSECVGAPAPIPACCSRVFGAEVQLQVLTGSTGALTLDHWHRL